MKELERLAKELLHAYDFNKGIHIEELSQMFVDQAIANEWCLADSEHPLLLAKALYRCIEHRENGKGNLIKLTLFCLLRNYLRSYKVANSDPRFLELIDGCEISYILIAEYAEYIFTSIFANELGMHIEDAENDCLRMLKLFGGIVKQSDGSNLHYIANRDIEDTFRNLVEPIYDYLPTGDSLNEGIEIFSKRIAVIVSRLKVTLQGIPSNWDDLMDMLNITK
ncbi:MAG: hypothetical protein HDS46_04715 [Bacteroides sp.]|nr:hypothetical protein [Bacteroides sp.]